jgi:hypothetical protein
MNYAPAYIIAQGYKFERTKSSDLAQSYRLWLNIAIQTEPQHRAEIIRLFEQGRAEAR